VEPTIGHLKAEHRMRRCHLKVQLGDALNAVLAAAGYNLRWPMQVVVASLRMECLLWAGVVCRTMKQH